MLFISTLCVLLTLGYGLDFEPKPPDTQSSLIFYRSGLELTSFHFRNRLNRLLVSYTIPNPSQDVIPCDFGVPPEYHKACSVDVDAANWGPCSSTNGYNYNSDLGGPCVFLKLQKDPDWIPEYYTSATVPARMPPNLKQMIKNIERDHGSDSNKLNVVWVSCEGRNPIDVENIGAITYFPYMGFGGQYFPIRNENHYRPPLVAVHFEKPERGIVINVECRAWARNLVGETVDFVLLIDY